VAEKAGVSVGSLYQYFPNKAAILFRLQSDEWRQTSELLRGILEDVRRSPLERLRTLVHAFIRSECDEAEMRVALNDAAPLYRDAPQAREARAAGDRTVQVFMQEALPEASEATRALVGNLITTTLSAVGKHFSETPRTSAEIEATPKPWRICFAPTSGPLSKDSDAAAEKAMGLESGRLARPVNVLSLRFAKPMRT
jgi:AcrR family transcriptional regulator